MTLPLHLKYRPATLEEVVGQDDVVRSLTTLLDRKDRNHAFLFTGPSGCGKTTLARIIASHVDCDASSITEQDAASNSGIDAMRTITEALRYKPFGAKPNKMIILDECHALSKAAWQALLKSLEEPPEHVFFSLCTTDAGKVPETIRTRCVTYDLKSVRVRDLQDLLVTVCDKEGFKASDEVIDLISMECGGSPRQALVMLAQCANVTDRDEAARLLSSVEESKEVIDLCRLMVSGRGLTWEAVVKVLRSMRDENPESIRIVIVNYLTSVLLSEKPPRDLDRILDMTAAFSRPMNPSDKLAPILLAFGDFLAPRN